MSRATFLGACVALVLSGIGRTAEAQVTFFQVASGEITKPGDFYLQQQGALADRLDVNAQAAVGLGHGFDVALNVYNLDFDHQDGRFRLVYNDDDREEPFGPVLLVGGQKEFALLRPFGVTLGIQGGPNLSSGSTRVAVRGYVNATAEFSENARCAAGGYLANGILLGGAEVQGAPWAGCDLEVVRDALELAADWDFGSHANGGATVGPQLRLFPSFAVAVGVRAPNPWADDAKWAGVLQFEVKDPLSG